MKRLLTILLLCSSAWATTTVQGNMQSLGSVSVTGGFMRFWLRGCAGNQPRVNGSGLIAPTLGGVYYFDLVANASGSIGGTLYSNRDSTGTGNGDIECGGSLTATWYGMQAFLGGKGGPETAVYAKSGSVLDISNVTPITTNPVVTAPTGDSTYLRLDAGNSPVTGNIVAKGLNGTLNAASFPGADIGAQAMNAYASGPALGVHIKIQSSATFSTPMVFNTVGKPVWLECDPGTTLTYTPLTGAAVSLGYGGAQLAANTFVMTPGITGCNFLGLGGTLGSAGSAICIQDGTTFFALSYITGVTCRGFNVGFQFNSNSSFSDTLSFSNFNFNNIGVSIANGANNTERNNIIFNNIANNVTGMNFGSAVGGGDWYVQNNSFDGNGCQVVSSACLTAPLGADIITQAAGGVGSQFLHVVITGNHFEDGGGLSQDILQFNSGLVDLAHNTFVIDRASGGPFPELVSAAGSTIDLDTSQIHSASVFNQFAKFSGGANARIGTLAFNILSGPTPVITTTYLSSGGGNICVYGIAATPQISCQMSSSTVMSLSQSGGSTTTLSSGGAGSSLNIAAGSAGLTLAPTVVQYNSIATVQNGIPSEYGTSDLTAQNTNVGPINVYGIPSSGAGLYRITGMIAETTADGASSTLPIVTIGFTQQESGVVQTLAVTTSGADLNGPATNGNTTSVFKSFHVIVSAAASTNIQVSTGSYSSGTAGVMKYSLHVRIEAL